jgi:N6-adenosine-specific RNA methylase IME4
LFEEIELQRLPVPDLAAKRCHLHVWQPTTSSVDAKAAIENWGLGVLGNFVWVKPQLGDRDY